MAASDNLQPHQFFHGSAHKLTPNQKLTPEGANAAWKKRAPGEATVNEVYSTTSLQGAAYYAGLRAHDFGKKVGHVYRVAPSADVSPDTSDPDATDQYRSHELTVLNKVHSVEAGEYG